MGALYVLDEPSIGLHTRDTARLIHILEELRDLGNTILVVEHDADILRAADHLLDLGPGAGEFGGKLLAEGVLAEIEANPSVADRALSEREDFDSRAHAAARAGTREAGAARGASQQSARARRGDSAGNAGCGDRRFRLGQVDAGAPGAVSRGGAGAGADAMAAIPRAFSLR